MVVLHLTTNIAKAQETGNNYFIRTDSSAILSIITEADKIAEQYPDSANRQYIQALELGKKAKIAKSIVYCAARIGAYYFNNKHDYTKGLEILKMAVPNFQKLDKNDYALIPMTCNLLGNCYFKTGINDSAICYYLKALRTFDSLDIKAPQLNAQVYGNMGAVLSSSGQYMSGINYLKKALTIQGINSSDLANVYANLGAMYANYMKDMDSATYWWSFAIKMYHNLSAKTQLQDIYANIGTGWVVVVWPHNLEKAQKYFDTAIQIDPVAAESNIQIQQGLSGIAYYKGNYTDAIKYSKKALQIAEKTGDRKPKQYAYYTLSYCYEHLHDTQQVFYYQRALSLLEDSLSNEKIIQSISESETKYRVSEKDKLLAQNRVRLYKQRLLLTGSVGGGALLAMLLLSFLYLYRQKQKSHKNEIRNLEQQQQIATLHTRMDAEEKERSRIARELHDGLGVLISAAKINYNLLGKTVTDEVHASIPYQEGETILDQIYTEMRTVSHNLAPDYIALRSLEEAMSQLITRLNTESFQIRLQTYGDSKELHPEKSFAIYRAIEEIINNALKHSQGTSLLVQLLYHTDKLHVITEDNGRGFDTSKIYMGLGIRNIARRIEDVGGLITLSSEYGKGTTYLMEISY